MTLFSFFFLFSWTRKYFSQLICKIFEYMIVSSVDSFEEIWERLFKFVDFRFRRLIKTSINDVRNDVDVGVGSRTEKVFATSKVSVVVTCFAKFFNVYVQCGEKLFIQWIYFVIFRCYHKDGSTACFCINFREPLHQIFILFLFLFLFLFFILFLFCFYFIFYFLFLFLFLFIFLLLLLLFLFFLPFF